MLADVEERAKGARGWGRREEPDVKLVGLTLVDAAAQERKLLDVFAGNILAVWGYRFGNLGLQSVYELRVADEVEASISPVSLIRPRLSLPVPLSTLTSDLQHPAHQAGGCVPPGNKHV